MPFEILPMRESVIVEMRLWGTVSTDDFADFNEQLAEMVGRTGQIRLLGDWQDFVGWTEDARRGRFSMHVKYRHRIDRMAILADIAKIAEVMRDSEILRFDPARRVAALKWLQEP